MRSLKNWMYLLCLAFLIQACGSEGGVTEKEGAGTDNDQNLNGSSLYATYCESCHGALASSDKVGATANQITAAISTEPTMSSLSGLSNAQIEAIASVL